MLALEPFLPNLTELHLNSNGIKGIGGLPGNSSAFLSLAVLSLEDNELREWAEVQTLGGLPSLERLHLSGNRLQEIHKPAALANGALTRRFANLLGQRIPPSPSTSTSTSTSPFPPSPPPPSPSQTPPSLSPPLSLLSLPLPTLPNHSLSPFPSPVFSLPLPPPSFLQDPCPKPKLFWLPCMLPITRWPLVPASCHPAMPLPLPGSSLFVAFCLMATLRILHRVILR